MKLNQKINLDLQKPEVWLPVFLLAVGAFVFGLNHIQSFNDTAQVQSICRLVYDKHYLGAKELKPWYGSCLKLVRQSDDLVTDLKSHLNELPGSHLELFTPTEHRQVWVGRAQYTGLRFRGINGRLILYEKHEQQKSDIPIGSELLAIDHQPVLGLEGVSSQAGLYKFKLPNSKDLEVPVETLDLEVDRAPEISPLGKSVGHLKIETFRNAIFDRTWSEVVRKLPSYKRIIIDLRGNWGGGFSSLMKALSPFLCGRSAGLLVSPRSTSKEKVQFTELSEQKKLLEQVGQARVIRLETVQKNNCFKGKVDILVDEETRSVSEMFAAALKGQPSVRVKGQKTSGAVVLAVWYDLEFLGADYSLSIPEALYQSPGGEVLEGAGLEPDEYLYYDLSEARVGIDTWL